MQEADYSRAMEAFGQGLAIARRAQDPTLEMATTAQAAQVDRFHLHPRRGLEKSLRAIELAGLVDDPHSEIQVRGVAAGCSLVVGDLEGARGHASAMLSLDLEVILSSWEEVLGVEVEIQQTEWATFLQDLKDRRYHMFTLGWGPDYADPENFLDILFHSESENNHTNYNNPEVDALLVQARVEPNQETRFKLYNKIEQMILDDAPWVLLWNTGETYALIKPQVKGYELTPMTIPKYRYVYLTTTTPAVPIQPHLGLVSWWPGDGHANDIVGDKHGTLSGDVTFTQGQVGLAFHFEGSGSVNLPNLGVISPEGTIQFWLRSFGALEPSGAFTTDKGGGEENAIRFEKDPLQSWYAVVGDDFYPPVGYPGAVVEYIFTKTLNTDWHHLALSWSHEGQNIDLSDTCPSNSPFGYKTLNIETSSSHGLLFQLAEGEES